MRTFRISLKTNQCIASPWYTEENVCDVLSFLQRVREIAPAAAVVHMKQLGGGMCECAVTIQIRYTMRTSDVVDDANCKMYEVSMT